MRRTASIEPVRRRASPPRALAAAVILLGVTGAGARGAAADLDISADLREAVTIEGVFRHLRAFQDSATRHGGNRAAGTPGYDASAGYVAGALRGAGYAVELQEFSFPYFEQTAPPILSLVDAGGAAGGGPVAEGEEEIRTLVFSGAGEVRARVEPVEFAPPERANGSTSGCEAADFEGLAAGSIALVRRGTCPFQVKVENAVAAGAVGVVIANDGAEGRTGAFPGRLTGPADVPVVGVGAAIGDRLERATRRPEGATARLAVAAETGERSTRNVIADTPGGDPERVVVVGAHLDSVPEGPGINDNGSGSAVVLETAVQMARLGIGPANRVRFAFWGAEELGLLGSRRHVDGLSEGDRARIAAVLNFDMVGSPNHGRFVYDGDGSHGARGGPDGSAAIERVFRDYFRAVGLAAEPTALGGDSDHAAFVAQGIAAGGLYTGGPGRKSEAQAALFGGVAGRPFDRCQHEACDTIGNVGARAIDEMADAAAHAVLVLALDRIPAPTTRRAEVVPRS
ncbi:MAG TPA: M20/M25/M40 family metallo-hydrolase [Geminicoccaceae bacterium]|nr:M20/M25/M40 family metallo-hydrolase [Geminicoccaceae bacterium]